MLYFPLQGHQRETSGQQIAMEWRWRVTGTCIQLYGQATKDSEGIDANTFTLEERKERAFCPKIKKKKKDIYKCQQRSIAALNFIPSGKKKMNSLNFVEHFLLAIKILLIYNYIFNHPDLDSLHLYRYNS